MVNIIKVSDNFKKWFMGELGTLASNNPAIKFAHPFIKRAASKKLDGLTKSFEWVADKEGNLDVDVLFEEIIENLKNPEVFNFEAPYIGNIEVGNSQIKMNVPMTDKKMLFKISDIELLRDALIE